MSNNRKAHQPVVSAPQNIPTPQPSSQIEATFSTLQLPIAASTNLSTQSPQISPMSQSILYRAENNTQFSRAKACLWEIKFIISSLVSKKGMPQASTDLQQLSEQFGLDFDKYLLRELLDQIDLKDANKPSRDRTEPVKCILLNEELKKVCENPEFLTYFDELSRDIFGESKNKEFLKEICARLKLSPKMALLIALSLHESSLTESDRVESAHLVKQKIVEYHAAGANKVEILEDYAIHRLIHVLKTYPEFESANDTPNFDAAKKFLIDHHQIKPYQNVALRLSLTDGDLINQNPTLEDPANSMMRVGSGLNHLIQTQKLLEPWEVLIDLGHYASYNYQMLSMALQDFKDINERQMARMLLHLSVHYAGTDDFSTRIVYTLFEVNKTGDATSLKKEPNDKVTQMQWHVGHFSRAFRENYSNLKWERILESFQELSEDAEEIAKKFDAKAYSFFLQLFSKSKPQNLQVPLSFLLDQKWQCTNLQLKFVQNAINAYISGEDKTFQFQKCAKRIGPLNDLQDASTQLIDVWSSPEVAQMLLALSETCSYHAVRQIFDHPIASCPQYLLLALSQVKCQSTVLLDELISILMSQVIEQHPTSTPFLKKLWDFNQQLMIRSISTLTKTEDLALNKVLDITQDIKDSLIQFVNFQEYDFAFSLGIIAGKRDYLNYDAWLRERITSPGFIKALVKYFHKHVLKPIQEIKDEDKTPFVEGVLEKAHLTKSRLTLTIEILQNCEDIKVRELILQISRLFPRQAGNTQQSETEKAANQYFELVFNAEPAVVEQRIAEFIQKIRSLSQSPVQRDREIHFCILNTFYEEYRFILSFRDRKNLISFAKLFGGIINKNIIEDTLMEISLKFIIQALQNDDNRLIFGIEALKQSYKCLSDFPRQFKEIYSLYEKKIKEQDPQFHTNFCKFYNQTFDEKEKTQVVSDIQSQGEVAQKEEQLQLTKQKDRGESQKAKPTFVNLTRPQQPKEKRKSPEQPTKSAEKELPGGLNIQSEAFNRIPERAANIVQPKPSINVNAITFNPTEVPQQPQQFVDNLTRQYIQPQEVQAWQEYIDRKISDAKAKRTEIRFEDLIEDPLLKQISQDAQKEIRFICNNTGTSTFDSQLEKAQNLLQGPNSEANLNWFLHYFLIQRLLTVPQLNIYIELFKQLGNKNVVSKSIKISVDIMKRCMLIPEEEFNKVVKRSAAQTNIIKSFLQQLGTFIGILTLASNRPIFSTEVDLKQMLIEGYRFRNKYVIIFVCRILREAPKSQIQIFNRSNPWIVSLLEILREIYDPNKQNDETQAEILLLFKDFGLNMHEFQATGFLKTIMTSQLLQSHSQQQAEAIYYDKKELIIPLRVNANQETKQHNQSSTSQEERPAQKIDDDFDNELRRHNNQQQIYNSVIVTPNALFRLFKITELEYRRVISEALEQSIKEILPPVVTRSVSIALITTKQLVLKDFTYDSDVAKVTEAINQFAKNSAGSLALVTCREPLRIALKEYLKKEIEQCCFKFGSCTGLINGDEIRQRDQSESAITKADEMDQALSQFIQENEEIISEVANNASQENLELGCNIIKNTVFDDTAKRIQQDEDIQLAMDKRRQAIERGEQFVDEQYVCNFTDLPEVLRPNPQGLTKGQLRVYSDFSKLNARKNDLSSLAMPSGGQSQTDKPFAYDVAQKQKEPTVHSFTLDSILNDIERQGMTSVTRALLTLKMQELSKSSSKGDIKVWRFTEKKFVDLQMCFDAGDEYQGHLDVLQCIVKKYKCEDLSLRLLNEVYVKMEEMYLFNVELNVGLLKSQILPLKEWDVAFASIAKNAPGNLQDKLVHFLCKFVETSKKHFSIDKLPSLLQAMKNLTFGPDSQSQQLKKQLDTTLAQIAEQQLTPQQKQMRAYFLQWVELSYITDTAAQELEMNNFFNNLRQFLQIDRDQSLLFQLCDVSICASLDLARADQNALLNYHFIDSFIKLVVLLLKAFDFNKQEFMSKILECIRVKLDTDYHQQLKSFNQKPYHRMLINILTAVNISDLFNSKIQRQILFDMADLLQQLRPSNYPAFAFAWLELISHRLFMPHFLKRPDPQQNQAWFQIKDLLVSCFSFLKHNMLPLQKSTQAVEAFYVGIIRIVLLILKDYPDFLCDFHFNFVNSLPEHAIQLKNMILAAVPRNVQAPDPLTKDLRLDIHDVKDPRVLSNFEAYLSVNHLKEDLDNYFKSKKHSLIEDICQSMMKSKERINGREFPSSAVINAVVLYITQQSIKDRDWRNKEESFNYNGLFQQITNKLNDETRVRFLNSIVNELRYPNSHTYCACFCLNDLFECSDHHIQQQIQRILFERLQSHRPHPWGLSINFRELIQNRKYGFMSNPFIRGNRTVDLLFQNRLRPFDIMLEEQKLLQQHQMNARPHLE